MAVIGLWGEGLLAARAALVAAGHETVAVPAGTDRLPEELEACLVAAQAAPGAAALLDRHRARVAPVFFPVLAVLAAADDDTVAASALVAADDTIAVTAVPAVWAGRLRCLLAARERSRAAVAAAREAGRLRDALSGLADGLAQGIDGPLTYLGGNLEFCGNAFARLVAMLDALTEAAMAPDRDDPAKAVRLVATLVELLADEDLRFALEEVPEAIRESREGLDRLKSLTGAVKRACGPGAADGLPVDTALAMEDAAILAGSAWKPVARLDVCPDPDLPPVAVPAGVLRLALVLLLCRVSRAIAALAGPDREPGRIELAARRSGEGIVLTLAWAGAIPLAGTWTQTLDAGLTALLSRHGIAWDRLEPAGGDGPDEVVILELPCRSLGALRSTPG